MTQQYTIDGETLYAVGDRLYRALDGEHGIEEIDGHAVHLFGHEDWGEAVPCRLDWGGPVYSQVKAIPLGGSHVSRFVRADEFGGAVPMAPLVPDGIWECPECGGWAGSKDEYAAPACIDCDPDWLDVPRVDADA